MELQLRLAMLSLGIKDIFRYPRFLVYWPVGHPFVDVVLRSPSTIEGEWLFEADEVFILCLLERGHLSTSVEYLNKFGRGSGRPGPADLLYFGILACLARSWVVYLGILGMSGRFLPWFGQFPLVSVERTNP